MLVRYKFVNETVEVEVSEEWGAVLREQDRVEYNNQQKETRRHVLLSNVDVEGGWFTDGGTMIDDLLQNEVIRCVWDALDQLTPKQRAAIKALYLTAKPLSRADCARELGVTEDALNHLVKRARKKLKEILESAAL